MPQLFPMNWIIITLIISILLSFMMINIYFFKTSNKYYFYKNILIFPFFHYKW
nr:ATP synthase F0 subunit 8 [Amblyomma calcaratum]